MAACARHGVHFTAYSALARTIIIHACAHASFAPTSAVAFLTQHRLRLQGSRGAAGVPGGHAAGGPELLDSPLVDEVARAAKRSRAQVLLQWALQTRPGCSALFKSQQRAHITDNAALLGWRLCDPNAEALSFAPLQRRFCAGEIFLSPRGPYKTLRDIWDDDGTGELPGEAAARHDKQ